MVEIHLIVASYRWKGVITNQDHMCDFVINTLSQLHLITEFNRMWRRLGLSLSSDAVINIFTYLKAYPNFKPFVFYTLRL